jgi:hypothetical protein
LSDVAVPAAPATVVDHCGNVLTGVLTNTSADPACTGLGTKTYTYTFTDCAGNTADWTYTYTIANTTALSLPGYGSSTVSCLSEATAPGAPAGVLDNCGNSLTGVYKTASADPSCTGSGTKSYTYTFTDCAGNTADWHYVYTIHHTTPPAEFGTHVSNSSIVQCITDAEPPTIFTVMKDVCGNILDT